jgi:selenocysteine lyase/cysteine desulfurase
LPAAAGEALRLYAQQAQRGAYLETRWYSDLEDLRRMGALLLGADAAEIAFIKNTSEGLATVAAGLDWSPGDRVVSSGVEYPANIYPWMELSRRYGVELVMVPEQRQGQELRVPLEHLLREAAHPRTRLVSLSHVEFGSGQRLDLATIGRQCRQQGKLLCVDAIQSLGALPVDVGQMNIDFLSADGHKWLLGPEGAGLFYCRRELLGHLRPLIVGWMNVVRAEDFGHYDYTLKPDARRYESGSHNVGGFLSLKAAVGVLLEAGIEQIAGRLKALTDRFIDGLVARGYGVVSPRGGDEWSGIVSFESPVHEANSVWRMLRKQHRVELAVRLGRLRCSPHFYNTEAQIDRLLELLPGH